MMRRGVHTQGGYSAHHWLTLREYSREDPYVIQSLSVSPKMSGVTLRRELRITVTGLITLSREFSLTHGIPPF